MQPARRQTLETGNLQARDAGVERRQDRRWFRHRLEWAGVASFAALVPRLPLPLLRRVADLVGTVLYVCDRRGRAVGLANLQCALGFPAGEARRVLRTSLRGFARAFLELFWSPRLSPQNFSRYLGLGGSDRALALARTPGGRAVFITPHFGNFEWGSMSLSFHGITGHVLTQAFDNPLLTPIFKRLRESAGQNAVTQDQSMVRFLRALRRGENVGVLTDLTLRMDEPGGLFDPFGLWTWTTVMHAVLHVRTGAPIIPFLTFPHADGRYVVELLDPLTFSRETPYDEIARRCWQVFEPRIRQRPELWLWSYKHWRYRPAAPERPYPFYANRSPWFDLEWEKAVGAIPPELRIY